MRIDHIEAVPYSLPFAQPYVTARGTLERREMVLLRMRTDDGVTGYGEAVPMSLRGDKPIDEVADVIFDAATRIQGLDLAGAEDDPVGFAIATLMELTAPRKVGGAAAAALECALFDLVAKTCDEPLWRFLGAEEVCPVRVNATLTAAEPADVAEQAAAWAADGYETFKLKLGAGFDDVAMVAAVREAVGPDARIRVDANEAYAVKDAVALLAEIEPHGIELAEQPVDGLRAMARVARETAVPLAVDEDVTSEADAHRAVQRGSCRFATAKLSKVGGIGAARQIARVLPTYLSSALDGPVGIAAAAHTAQLIGHDGNEPGIAHGLATQRLFAETIATTECNLLDGALHLPSGAGLGVAIDEAALDAHRL